MEGTAASGDGWVEIGDSKYWGLYGAAGLLLWWDGTVLLQLRAERGHEGGTWGMPGGARDLGETAVAGALREALEEAAVPADAVEPLDEHVVHIGEWSYTTVIARALRPVDAVAANWESEDMRWVPVGDVAAMPLHPGFAAAWPVVRGLLLERVNEGDDVG